MEDIMILIIIIIMYLLSWRETSMYQKKNLSTFVNQE